MIPAIAKLMFALGAGTLLLGRSKKIEPNEGGGFIENSGGIIRVRNESQAWVMAQLDREFVAPTPLGEQYPDTWFAQLRQDGGLGAKPWAVEMARQGRDVAITSTGASTGALVAFPKSARRLWCEPGRGYALLLAGGAAPAPAS